MKPWLRWLLIAVAVLVVVYGAFAAFTSYSNGTKVHASIHVGRLDTGAMYLRCDEGASTPGVCSGGDQSTVTVKSRDRLTFDIYDDQGGGHRHDFNVPGWQYFIWPNSPETELNAAHETVTITTWASGSFNMICEISGHNAAGMHGKLVVK